MRVGCYQGLLTTYGLRQAGRVWSKTLADTLTKMDFTQIKSDPSVYVFLGDWYTIRKFPQPTGWHNYLQQKIHEKPIGILMLFPILACYNVQICLLSIFSDLAVVFCQFPCRWPQTGSEIWCPGSVCLSNRRFSGWRAMYLGEKEVEEGPWKRSTGEWKGRRQTPGNAVILERTDFICHAVGKISPDNQLISDKTNLLPQLPWQANTTPGYILRPQPPNPPPPAAGHLGVGGADLSPEEGGLSDNELCVTAHDEGERQSYIDGINTTIYYQKNSHNHMTGWHSHLQHFGGVPLQTHPKRTAYPPMNSGMAPFQILQRMILPSNHPPNDASMSSPRDLSDPSLSESLQRWGGKDKERILPLQVYIVSRAWKNITIKGNMSDIEWMI